MGEQAVADGSRWSRSDDGEEGAGRAFTMRGIRSRLSITPALRCTQPMRLRVAATCMGLSDLNYYGSFINAPGYGSFWQPYFVGAGWSPYANGLWAFYPGAGYSWVSPYPWGWLPYHSGSWSFVPGYGWGWQPGSTFNGLNNVAMTGMSPSTGMSPTGTMAGGTATRAD